MNIDFNKYFNFSTLSVEQQQLIVGAITDLVLTRMADMIGEHLTEHEISQLETLATQGDGQQIIQWLNHHIPNFAQGVNELLEEESTHLAQQVTALTNHALAEA